MFKNIKDASQVALEKAKKDYELNLATWKSDRKKLVEQIEVTYGGHIFQGDETSQDRMSRAINGLPNDTTPITWLSKDNQEVQLFRPDLRNILFEAGSQQTAIWNVGRPQA